MGVMHVPVTISILTRDRQPYEAEFLVDMGAVDCMAPRDDLLTAGIQSEGKAVYELANGQPVEYEYGFTRVGFIGAETVAREAAEVTTTAIDRETPKSPSKYQR